MTDKDKQTLARADMLKLQLISKRLHKLNEDYNELISSLYGTGIDYSRDHVQTSPTNQMEIILCERVCDITAQIEDLLKQRDNYLITINKLPQKEAKVLKDKYIRLLSFRDIAREYDTHKSNVYDLEKKALTLYHNIKLYKMLYKLLTPDA